MATLLEQLRGMTTVVADSGDINSIEQFKPTDSTTNPSLIAAAAQMPAYAPIVDDVLMEAREQAGPSASDKTSRRARLQVARRRLRQQDPRDRPRPRLHRGRRAPLLRHGKIHRAGTRHHRAVRRRPASAASASSSRSPPPGRASRPPRSWRRKASTAT